MEYNCSLRLVTGYLSLVICCCQGAGKEPVTVRHFQFLAWPNDSILPSNNMALFTLFNMLEKWQQQSGNGVIVAHCV